MCLCRTSRARFLLPGCIAFRLLRKRCDSSLVLPSGEEDKKLCFDQIITRATRGNVYSSTPFVEANAEIFVLLRVL